jgi:enterochelin esterase family protein
MEMLPALEFPPLVAELAAANPRMRAEMLRSVTSPLVDDGERVTFVHLGEATAVSVRHFMARFPAIPPLQHVAPGLHAVTVALPHRSRVEYKLVVAREGQSGEALDEYNPRRATDPFGANCVAFGPGYVTPWWATPAEPGGDRLRRGFVETEAFGRRRFLRWYRPDVAGGRLPLLVVHDGRDFIRHAGIVDVLDHLIATGRLPPLVAALIDPGERLTEYADDPRHAAFVGDVVAAAVRRHGADPDPDAHVYLGASLGAVAALAAAWRTVPVGGVVLLSGSFVTALGGPMGRGERFLPVIDFMERFTAQPARPAARIYQSCGAYEGLAPDNQAFTPVLAATGGTVHYEEVPDGHHWHNWRDRLAAALTHTLPDSRPADAGTVRP